MSRGPAGSGWSGAWSAMCNTSCILICTCAGLSTDTLSSHIVATCGLHGPGGRRQTGCGPLHSLMDLLWDYNSMSRDAHSTYGLEGLKERLLWVHAHQGGVVCSLLTAAASALPARAGKGPVLELLQRRPGRPGGVRLPQPAREAALGDAPRAPSTRAGTPSSAARPAGSARRRPCATRLPSRCAARLRIRGMSGNRCHWTSWPPPPPSPGINVEGCLLTISHEKQWLEPCQ